MTSINPQIEAQIDHRTADWVALRRDLHQHPELAFEEVRTSGIVAARLGELGLEVQTGVGRTGVIGVLEGDHDGPTVMVRADMDALPIHEETGAVYASKTPGKMHACGHDGHTTIALAVAEVLSTQRAQMAGRVKFVFQPAEEIGLGAEAMIKDGALGAPEADVTLGLHLWNTMPVGTVVANGGPLMAAANDVLLRVIGTGGHGANPHEARDPIVAAAHIVTALQSIVSRSADPSDALVLSITEIKGGDSYNVIPPIVTMRGTIRTYNTEVRDLAVNRLQVIATGIAEAMGCRAEVEVRALTMPVINSAEVAARLRAIFAEVAPGITFLDDYRMMVSEDVSYFLNAVPGVFFLVGSADPARGLNAPHHHPRFDFDDTAAIPLAVRLMTAAVASYVLPG